MICRIRLITILFAFAFPALCSANSVVLAGIGNFGIRRSHSGNWSSSSGMTLAAENTLAPLHKIVVEGTLIAPEKWQGRYFRVRLDVPLAWQVISPTIFSIQRDIVGDGVANAPADLVRNIALGDYPPAPLFYEGRADKDALPGDATLTITITIISQL